MACTEAQLVQEAFVGYSGHVVGAVMMPQPRRSQRTQVVSVSPGDSRRLHYMTRARALLSLQTRARVRTLKPIIPKMNLSHNPPESRQKSWAAFLEWI